MENIIQLSNIAPIRPSAPAGTTAPASPLSQMQPGDTLSVLVSGTDGDGVTLTLPDGTSLHASTKAGQPLQAQDTLVLQLTSDNGSAPSLRLLEVNSQPVTAQVPLLDMTLMEMNIPASRANVAAAALLSKLGFPVDGQTLSRFGELRASFPALPAEQAAVFAGSNIPINEQNVSAFAQFVRSPAQAGSVAAALESALAESGSLLSPNVEITLPVQTAQASSAPQPGAQVPAEAATLTQSEQAATAPVINTAPDSPEASHGTQPSAQDPAQSTQAAPLPQQAAAQSAPDARHTAANPAAFPLTGDEKTVADALRAVFPKLLPEESDSLGKALQKAVPALASRIAALSDAAASSHGQGAKEASQLGAQFVRQMSFGNEMASLFYTQIPFNYKENRSNAELYVLKRNRGENGIDPSNATIALCLDTAHMGKVESLVQVRSQELSFNFRVETQEVKSIIQDELTSLASLDFPSQYRYKGASVSLMESPITPVNAAKLMRETFGMNESSGIDISI